jgi:hypothetical protein
MHLPRFGTGQEHHSGILCEAPSRAARRRAAQRGRLELAAPTRTVSASKNRAHELAVSDSLSELKPPICPPREELWGYDLERTPTALIN